MTTPGPSTPFIALGLAVLAIALLLVRVPGDANVFIASARLLLILLAMLGSLAAAGLWIRSDFQSMLPAKGLATLPPALQTVQVLTSAGTDCPQDVQEDIARLWRDHEMGNDNWHFGWESGATSIRSDGTEVNMSRAYPAIDRYLKARGVSDCLIHHWW